MVGVFQKKKAQTQMGQTSAKKFICERLEKAWSVYYCQDASVDLKQTDNEFHCCSYVDFQTGKLKHEFLGAVEKPSRGAKGQVEAFQECILRLYPEQKRIPPGEIFNTMKKAREESMKVEDEPISILDLAQKPGGFEEEIDFENI